MNANGAVKIALLSTHLHCYGIALCYFSGVRPNVVESNDALVVGKVGNELRITCIVFTMRNAVVLNVINCPFFSDDFELNKIKRGAKSYWIKTIALSPTVHNFDSKAHTCFLAAGHKGENHD